MPPLNPLDEGDETPPRDEDDERLLPVAAVPLPVPPDRPDTAVRRPVTRVDGEGAVVVAFVPATVSPALIVVAGGLWYCGVE